MLDWVSHNNIPASRLFLGEFGVATLPDKGALNSDRSRWLLAVRKAAEASGIAWAFWEYTDADSVAMDAMGFEGEPIRAAAAN